MKSQDRIIEFGVKSCFNCIHSRGNRNYGCMQTYEQPGEYAYCEGCNADMSDNEYDIMWNNIQNEYKDNPSICDKMYDNDEQMLADKCEYYTPEIVKCCNCKTEINAYESLYAGEDDWACSKECQQILDKEIKEQYKRMEKMEMEMEEQIKEDQEFMQETHRWLKCNKDE